MIRTMCVVPALVAIPLAFATDYRIQTIAGSSFNGDGGPASQAEIGAIQGIAVDAAGNFYLSDTDHHRVRKVSSSGIISTVAGTGIAGFSGDGGIATAAQLNLPYGLAVDTAGNLYIADLGNNRIRRVAVDGKISTYAGGGTAGTSDEGSPAVSTALRTPRNVVLDAAGNLYLAEFEGHRVRKVTPDGRIVTVAGSGVAGFAGDGGPASAAQLAYPAGLTIDRAGTLYIADSNNQRIRKIDLNGIISTVAGGTLPLHIPIAVAVQIAGTLDVSDGSGPVRVCPPLGPYTTLAGAVQAGDLALDPGGNLYVADGSQVRRIDTRGQVTTVAGDDYQHAIGDGGPAVAAQLSQPSAVALDAAGNIYIADTGTGRVREVSQGVIQTVAGPQNLNAPAGIAFTPAGDLIVADTGDQFVRKVANTGLSTVAGTGSAGAGPEGLAAAQTALNGPRGVCAGSDGSLYIVDTGNHRVLRLPPGGAIETSAGNGSPGNAGDGGLARLAQLNQPSACAVDSAGALWIADTGNNRIRRVSAGAISTIAGADGSLNAPRGVAPDDSGNVFIADSGNNRICLLAPGGSLQTIAGPDQLASPGGLALDASGNLYVADTGNNRILQLVPSKSPPLSVLNAASLQAGPVSPGEIVSLFGASIGPDKGIAGAFDSTGALPTQLNGWEVHFDGVPAPLLYTQSGQLNAQVPYSLTGASTHVEVLGQGITVASTDLIVAPAAPALFPSTFTESNPAQRGSIAIFYATGEGLTDGPNIAGQAAAPPYPQPAQAVTLTVAGVPAQLLYAGSAPGTAGVLQLNAIIPGGFIPPGPAIVRLTVGNTTSPALAIWLQ
jgi:uncharacterized protein (TIGR03437 family)